MDEFRRAFIREGDTTTAGGVVEAGKTGNILMHGKRATFEGDPVSCPACEVVGVTACVQPFIPNTGPDGRQRCLDGDLCLCRCSPPPRLQAREQNYSMCFSKACLAKRVGAEGWLAYAGHSGELTRFDEFFVIHDRATGKPFSGYAYAIKAEAGTHEGRLNEDGRTAKVHAETAESVELLYALQIEIGLGK